MAATSRSLPGLADFHLRADERGDKLHLSCVLNAADGAHFYSRKFGRKNFLSIIIAYSRSIFRF